jgi:hypothetical protein
MKILIGWWVGFGCCWAKLNVVFFVGKCVGKTPLLILGSVGIFSVFFCSFIVGRVVF